MSFFATLIEKSQDFEITLNKCNVILFYSFDAGPNILTYWQIPGFLSHIEKCNFLFWLPILSMRVLMLVYFCQNYWQIPRFLGHIEKYNFIFRSPILLMRVLMLVYFCQTYWQIPKNVFKTCMLPIVKNFFTNPRIFRSYWKMHLYF